jgi:uncharacterized membrane protein
MNCPKCQTQNEENAQFCRNCGIKLYISQVPQANTKTVDTLILIFLIYLFISSFTGFAIQKLFDNWYEGTLKNIQIGMNLIYAFTPILLVIAIKNKAGRIFGIILASIFAIYIVYLNVNWMLN